MHAGVKRVKHPDTQLLLLLLLLLLLCSLTASQAYWLSLSHNGHRRAAATAISAVETAYATACSATGCQPDGGEVEQVSKLK